ncbi:molecular chaperone DnaK [Naasia aerilata]|uniref:Molecular chaperone DnaK n=1 Tax=Naasia aerilata TaxID=1162966 RepID=A0ABM8GEM1_9MICO|nr:molecular chaperone DnaK [Naasia aerilata]
MLAVDEPSAVPLPVQLGSQRSVVPSVAFVPENGRILVGEAAERRGRAAPDRLVREFKSRIGDAVPIVVGDLSLPAEELYAAVARWVVDRVEEREGAAPEAVALTHPAAWGSYKLGLVSAALREVGLDDVLLVTEPEAAARHYAGQERVAAGAAVAVYDLGGGTFDVAVVRAGDRDRFAVLGRPQGIEQLGGRDFDDAVVRHVTGALQERLEGLDAEDPEVLLALARLRSDCVEAKEALSFDGEATIPVMLPGLHTQVRLVRGEFEGMIEEAIRDTIALLASAAESAGLDVQDLSVVLLVGGSSRIPLVAELVSEELGRPVAVDTDPKAAISLGAAAAAAAALRPVELPVGASTEPVPTPTEPIALPYAPHPPRFGAGVAAFASGGGDLSSLRTRAVLLAAAAIAGVLVFAGPASPTAVGNDPFASEAAHAEGNGSDAVAATELPAESPSASDAQSAPAPEDTTLDLVTAPDEGASPVFTPVSMTQPAPSAGTPAGGTGGRPPRLQRRRAEQGRPRTPSPIRATPLRERTRAREREPATAR